MNREKYFWVVVICLLTALFLYRTVYRSASFFIESEDLNWDMDFWYSAGSMWLEGENPYDNKVFSQRMAELRGEQIASADYPFSYPPHVLTLFSLFALLPLKTVVWVMFGVNLVLIFLLLFMIGKIVSFDKPVGWPEAAFIMAMLCTGIRTNLNTASWVC